MYANQDTVSAKEKLALGEFLPNYVFWLEWLNSVSPGKKADQVFSEVFCSTPGGAAGAATATSDCPSAGHSMFVLSLAAAAATFVAQHA